MLLAALLARSRESMHEGAFQLFVQVADLIKHVFVVRQVLRYIGGLLLQLHKP